MSAQPEQAQQQSAAWSSLVTPERTAGLTIVMLAFVAYLVTGSWDAGGDSFVPLADALLHGSLSIPVDRPWLELIPVPGGGGAQYSPFPPIPAVVLMPAVAVTHLLGVGELSSNLPCAVAGALNVGLAYWLLGRIGVAFRSRQVITIGFAFTTHWWVAGMAGTHLWAQTLATTFLLATLVVAVSGRRPVLAGFLLALAAGSRLPTALALPLVLACYAPSWRPTREHVAVLAGIAAPALLIAWYNLARFGSPFDFGYARIPSGENGVVTDEPWFRYGLVSPLYIPRHLYAMLLQSFEWVDSPPFMRPSYTGLALTLSAPFLFWAASAWHRWRANPLVLPAFASVLLVLLPDVMHGSWGFAQFGYRFALDAIPILVLLIGWAYRERASASLVGAVALGVAVHAYGIYVINVGGFVN